MYLALDMDYDQWRQDERSTGPFHADSHAQRADVSSRPCLPQLMLTCFLGTLFPAPSPSSTFTLILALIHFTTLATRLSFALRSSSAALAVSLYPFRANYIHSFMFSK